MTQRVKQLIAESRSAMISTEEQLLLHPYMEALEKKGLGKGKLPLFTVQQHYVMKYNVMGVEVARDRAASPNANDFMSEVVHNLRAASDALDHFGESLGLSTEMLYKGEPLSGAIAYSMYVYWLASKRTTAEFAAAFLVGMPSWGANCIRVGRALQANYGFAKKEIAFFDTFSVVSPELEKVGMEVIAEGLDHGVDTVLIRRSVRLLLRYELMFWDTMWERSRS